MAQNLFRRHRGGTATSGGGTRETSTSAVVDVTRNNGGVIDENNNNNNNIATNNEEEDISTSNIGSIMMTSLNERDVENPESSIDTTSDNNNATTQEVDEENNNDEIQELVVRMPPNHTYRSSNNSNNINNNIMEFPNWTLNEDEINFRREAIRTEVERMQRNNCIHFAVLCLVPTSLLLIVMAAILSEDGECSGDGLTVCEREPRTFVNAFTTRCICDAVGSVASMMMTQDNVVDGGVGEMGATTGEETP